MASFETKEQLYEVLDRVVAELQKDETFKSRIAHADASLAFIVSDLDNAEYVLKFSKGELTSAKEGAAQATVAVTLKADTLDKMLSGKLSGESAYFAGLIRLRGDEWVAQGLAGYLYALGPIYRRVTGQEN